VWSHFDSPPLPATSLLSFMSASETPAGAAERLQRALNRLPTSSCYDCFRDELVSSGAADLGRKPKFKLRHN